jgi:hypothetical protein
LYHGFVFFIIKIGSFNVEFIFINVIFLHFINASIFTQTYHPGFI